MPIEEIIPLLLQGGLFTKSEVNQVLKQRNRFQKNILLLRFVIQKPRGFLQKFYNLLSQTSHASALREIVSEDTLGKMLVDLTAI